MAEKGGRGYLIASVLVVDLLAMTAGLMLAWSSPVSSKLGKLEDNPIGRVLTDEEISWIGSLLSLGAVFGPFLVATGAEFIGRKWTLVGLAVPFVFGCFLLAFAEDVASFYAARFIAGLSVGGLFILVPNYITEIADDAVRGALGTSLNVLVTTGQLIAYGLGPYVSIMVFSIVCAIPPIIFAVIFTLAMSDTPQFLIAKGNDKAAKVAYDKFRGPHGSLAEFENIKAYALDNPRGNVKDLFSVRTNRKALLISIALIVFQQLSGITVILYYAQDIFDATKSTIPSEISSIILGAVQAAASLVTPIFVDRYGRKIILMMSSLGMVIGQVPLGLYFFLDDVDDISWLPIVCLVVYIGTYTFGMGILPWTITAELLPSDIKAYASPITASICWLASFLLTKFFNSISEEIGMSGTFWLFAGFNALSIVFTFIIVPETKGKSVQEIQQML